jgi:hypothetical protein
MNKSRRKILYDTNDKEQKNVKNRNDHKMIHTSVGWVMLIVLMLKKSKLFFFSSI